MLSSLSVSFASTNIILYSVSIYGTSSLSPISPSQSIQCLSILRNIHPLILIDHQQSWSPFFPPFPRFHQLLSPIQTTTEREREHGLVGAECSGNRPAVRSTLLLFSHLFPSPELVHHPSFRGVPFPSILTPLEQPLLFPVEIPLSSQHPRRCQRTVFTTK